MSTSNAFDFDDEFYFSRYGASSTPGSQSQSRARYADQQMYQPQPPTPQILGEILTACSLGDLYKLTHYGSTYDLNVGDYQQRRPIHLAASEGQALIVSFLITMGVNVNCEDRFGNTPLREALRGNHPEIVKMLREAGANMGQACAHVHMHATQLHLTRILFCRQKPTFPLRPRLLLKQWPPRMQWCSYVEFDPISRLTRAPAPGLVRALRRQSVIQEMGHNIHHDDQQLHGVRQDRREGHQQSARGRQLSRWK
jgi:hypothetical protein